MSVLSLPVTAQPLLEVDPDRWEARVRGQLVDLTRMEFELLTALYEADGRVITRGLMADRIGLWSEATRPLDAHVCRIRRKLGEAGALIVTVRGVGWKLRRP